MDVLRFRDIFMSWQEQFFYGLPPGLISLYGIIINCFKILAWSNEPFLRNPWSKWSRGDLDLENGRGVTFQNQTRKYRCPTTYERSGDSVCAPKCPEMIPYHAYTYYGTSVKILKRLEHSARNYRTFTKGGSSQKRTKGGHAF